MNLDKNNQIARSCDQLGHIGSPKNSNFGWVLALYFCPLVFGHPVSSIYQLDIICVVMNCCLHLVQCLFTSMTSIRNILIRHLALFHSPTLECSRLFQKVQDYSEMIQIILKCPRLILNIPYYSRMFIQWSFKTALKCSKSISGINSKP